MADVYSPNNPFMGIVMGNDFMHYLFFSNSYFVDINKHDNNF